MTSTDTTSGDNIVGVGAAGGIATGPPLVLEREDRAGDGELRPLEEAVEAVTGHYRELARRARDAGRDEEAEILEAYELLIDDPGLREEIRDAARDAPLDEAVRSAGEAQVAELAELEDEYLSQRAEDLAAAVSDLVAAVRGQDLAIAADVAQGAIVVARELSPAETSQLDIERLGGFAIEGGGVTSHTAIVARSHGLPAVVGAEGVVNAAREAALVLVDGDAGTVDVDPDEETRVRAEERAATRRTRRERAARLTGTAVQLGDRRILVAANVGNDRQLSAAIEAQADGIGLYRTEFLYLGDDRAPTRQAQAEAYRAAVEAFDDPVIVRTLDIGGDKESRWLDLDAEDNPFLGVRGLRLALRQREVLETQLDALLEVAAVGQLRIMLPMVSTLRDVRRAREVLDERAAAAGSEPPPLGVMIETPAAALLARHLADEVAFFSLGTNDLTQYTTAADRGVAALSEYHDPVAPPVLTLAETAIRAAVEAGIPVGVCGAAAADPAAAVLLLGMGVDELSVPPADVDVIRALVDELDPATLTALASRVVDLPDADAVRSEVHDAVGDLLW